MRHIQPSISLRLLTSILVLWSTIQTCCAQDGTLDLTFGLFGVHTYTIHVNDGITDEFEQFLPATDDKFYAHNYDHIYRFLPDGITPDSSFVDQGQYDIESSARIDNGFIFHMASTADGGVIYFMEDLTTDSLYLQRLSLDGSQTWSVRTFPLEDPVFDGLVTSKTMIRELANGQIMLVGTHDILGETVKCIRLNADFSTDVTYGTDGFVFAPLVNTPQIEPLAIQGDGAVLIKQANQSLILLDANGQPQYGTEGFINLTESVVVPWTRDNIFVGDIDEGHILPDGKVLIAGTHLYDLVGSVGLNVLFLARFLPDGRPDPSFGVNGAMFDTTRRLIEDVSILIQPDEKILAWQEDDGSTDFVLSRYLSNGQPDPDFGEKDSGTEIDISSLFNRTVAIVQLANGQVLGLARDYVDNLQLALRFNNTQTFSVSLSSAEQSFRLYPNPTTDVLIIDSEVVGRGFLSDLNGRRIQTWGLHPGQNELIIRDLSPGTYYVVIESGKGLIQERLMIRR